MGGPQVERIGLFPTKPPTQSRAGLLAHLSLAGALLAKHERLRGLVTFLAANARRLLRAQHGLSLPVRDATLLLMVRT
jgi:hypothetical protein